MRDIFDNIKTVKINGIKFVIRKLDPEMFLDADYFLPVSTIAADIVDGKAPTTNLSPTEIIKLHKEKVRDIIVRAVVRVKSWLYSAPIDNHIETIMIRPAVYNKLFSEILEHTLDLKKKIMKASRN